VPVPRRIGNGFALGGHHPIERRLRDARGVCDFSRNLAGFLGFEHREVPPRFDGRQVAGQFLNLCERILVLRHTGQHMPGFSF